MKELEMLALFGGMGWVEILIIVVVVLLIFGRRLPELGKGLGKSIMEFKKGIHENNDQKKQNPPQDPPADKDDQ